MLNKIVLAIALGTSLTACRAEPVREVQATPKTPEERLERPLKGEYTVYVTSVYDGDTFKFNMPGFPPELNPMSIRVRGVDTPERKPKAVCASEHERAMKARQFTLGKINETGGSVVIKDIKWDKYGGRIDADVLVGKDRQSLSRLLIANDFGHSYDGGKRVEGQWCK